MNGVRLDFNPKLFCGGDYGLYENVWYARLPESGETVSLADHTVLEHEDGTITVSPNIQSWRLERGVWKS